MTGLFLFSFLSDTTSFYLIGANLAFIGIGFGLFSSPNNNAIMGAVKAEFYGIASSIVAVMRLIGQAVSMAIVTLILSIYTADIVMEQYVDMILAASKNTFLLFSILCVIGLIASLMRGKEKQNK